MGGVDHVRGLSTFLLFVGSVSTVRGEENEKVYLTCIWVVPRGMR